MSQALASANQTDPRENYCKLLIWWKSPDEIKELITTGQIFTSITISILARFLLSKEIPSV